LLVLQAIEGPLNGRIFHLAEQTAFLGRSSRNDLQIMDSSVSRKQIKIFASCGKTFLEDLKSTNGTLLNGSLIQSGKGVELVEGDVISMGATSLKVVLISSLESEAEAEARASGEETREIGHVRTERRTQIAKNVEAIHVMSRILTESASLNQALERILDYLFEMLPRIDRGAFLLLGPKRNQIIGEITRSRPETSGEGQRYSPTVVNRVLQEGQTLRMFNTAYEASPEFSPDMDTLEIGSVVCIPIGRPGKTNGVLYLDSVRGPYGFRKDDLLLLESLAAGLTLALENQRLALRLKKRQDQYPTKPHKKSAS
jgi:pSer/pThr/pTyr-binding forkhead associated (FHA) protein